MATRGANGSTAPALSGLVHVWFYDIDKLEPPKELDGANLPGPLPSEHPETVPKTWFQGHIFPPSTAPTTQYTILGVPAHSPPQVHGCMVSDHDTPTYYDIYISEYDGSRSKVRFCAYGVERSGGSGDAIEMALSAPAAGTSPSANTANSCFVGAQRASALKLSTTRMMSAHSPPQVHGCMVSDHDTPTYYDIYISEYDGSRSKVRFCAYGVERSGGSGDAIEMALSAPAAGTSPSAKTANSCFVGAQRASALKLSTTRMMSGDRAQLHLAKYAPDALQAYRGANIAASDCVVCLVFMQKISMDRHAFLYISTCNSDSGPYDYI
ncbi:hypothetical protein GQ54DRAFT_336159 [Martensiomyces pterosporus]|nr:hypothetical protein GQ54DRAFT_336159 [Martensiomyces pterosporus]